MYYNINTDHKFFSIKSDVRFIHQENDGAYINNKDTSQEEYDAIIENLSGKNSTMMFLDNIPQFTIEIMKTIDQSCIPDKILEKFKYDILDIDPSAFKYFKYLSLDMVKSALCNYPSGIRWIKSPTMELWMISLEASNGWSIEYLSGDKTKNANTKMELINKAIKLSNGKTLSLLSPQYTLIPEFNSVYKNALKLQHENYSDFEIDDK